MNTGQISNPFVQVKPSEKLIAYVKTIEVSPDLTSGLSNFIFKNKINVEKKLKPKELKPLITDKDREYLTTLNLHHTVDTSGLKLDSSEIGENEKLLNLHDLHYLHGWIQERNKQTKEKIYLHELLEGSEIILPKNIEIPRNAELEKRCQKLRASQQNVEYSNMTKNVDNVRRRHPEDTIAYQMKEMNRHLIAIAQFIMSVLAGFAFGFTGVELIVGGLDFGFRLLLGIICALTIALAELYFLAKKLNEDLKFEKVTDPRKKTAKID